MKVIFNRKREGNLSIPFKLTKTSTFHRVVDITDNELLFKGIIIVNPVIVNSSGEQELVSWALINLSKNEKIMDGVGEQTLSGMDAGIYGIEYNPFPGYITPQHEVKNLGEHQTLTFSAIYEKNIFGGELDGIINISMNNNSGGWRIEHVDDDNNLISAIPDEGFRNDVLVSFNDLPLGNYNLKIKDIGNPILSPSFDDRFVVLDINNNEITWDIEYETTFVFQTEFNIQVNYNIPSDVFWVVRPRNRENEIYSGSGNYTQQITLPQDNEFWKITLDDLNENFVNKIVKIKGQAIERLNNEYVYGVNEDLIFSLNSNNLISIDIVNADDPTINWFDLNYDNAIANEDFYRDLITTVEIYENESDLTPSNIYTVVTDISRSGVVPDPSSLVEYPTGYYKFKFTKLSVLDILVASPTGTSYEYEYISPATGDIETVKFFVGEDWTGFITIKKPI